MRTLVLERRDTVGGAAETSELAPGSASRRWPTPSAGCARRSSATSTSSRIGSALVGPARPGLRPGPDGGAVVLWADPVRTADGLRARSGHDADAYVGFDRLVRSLAGFLGELAGRTPPDIARAGHRRRAGRAEARADVPRPRRADARTLTRVLPMAVADFVAEAFETDAVQAAIAWRGVQYTRAGPVVGRDDRGPARRLGRQRRRRGRPDGLRPGRAGRAWRRRWPRPPRRPAWRSGPAPRSTAITSHDGRATGVVLASGEELEAAVVVSGLDPKRTLTRLRDPVADRAEPALAGRQHPDARHGRQGQPRPRRRCRRFPAAATAGGDDTAVLRGRIVLAPGIDAMERAHDAAKFGRLPDEPMMEATIPSLVDPSLVEGGPDGHATS